MKQLLTDIPWQMNVIKAWWTKPVSGGCRRKRFWDKPVELLPKFVDGKYAFFTRPMDDFIDTGSSGGVVSNVVFTNGAIAEEDGKLWIYYAASDTRLHVASTTIDRS